MATVGTPWASFVWRIIPKIVDHLEGEFSNQSGCGNNVEARSGEQYQHYSLITLKCDLQARQVWLGWSAWQKPTKIITITSVPWLYIMWCQFVLFTTSVCTSKIIDSWTLTFSASRSWALHSCVEGKDYLNDIWEVIAPWTTDLEECRHTDNRISNLQLESMNNNWI